MKPFTRYEKVMIRYALSTMPRRRALRLDDFATCEYGPLQGELFKVVALQTQSEKACVQLRPNQGILLLPLVLLVHFLDYIDAIVEVMETDEVLQRLQR